MDWAEERAVNLEVMRRVFPAPVEDADYWAILRALYPDWSDRQLASFVADALDRADWQVINDVYAAGNDVVARERGVVDPGHEAEVLRRLRAAGWTW